MLVVMAGDTVSSFHIVFGLLCWLELYWVRFHLLEVSGLVEAVSLFSMAVIWMMDDLGYFKCYSL